MNLQILTDAIDQAVSMAENANTLEARSAALAIIIPARDRLNTAIKMLRMRPK